MKTVKVNEPDPRLRTAFFDIRSLNGLDPALNEEGGQPLISINRAPFTTTGIGVLNSIGRGRYYAELDILSVRNIGTSIETTYKSANTVESPGDEFQVIASSDSFTLVTPAVLVGAYIDVNSADAYFQTRLRSNAWTNASLDDKRKALIEATMIIDSLDYSGIKSSPNQLLEFPRNGQLLTDDIKIACCEIGIKLLEGIDIDQMARNLNVSSQGYSSVKTTYDKSFIPDHIRAGIPSIRAWGLLFPYLQNKTAVTLRRVN